jgi:hypothetical protein
LTLRSLGAAKGEAPLIIWPAIGDGAAGAGVGVGAVGIGF